MKQRVDFGKKLKKNTILVRTCLEGASTHFVLLKTRFKRKLDQTMLENALFFGKSWKNCCSIGDSATKPPLASGGWRLCPHTPKLLLSSLVSMTLKIRPLISCLSDG